MIYKMDELETIDKSYDKVAIGYFDGLHLGHQTLLSNFNKTNNNDLIITFTRKGEEIITLEDKLTMLEKNYNCDIIVLNLESDGILKSSKEKFIQFLKDLNVKEVYVGEDFHFGYKAEGNVSDLNENFVVLKQKLLENNNNQKVSSSQIRELLKNGNLVETNSELGYNYFIVGIVQKGNQIGRTINFPTMNLEYKHCLLPNGIYKTKTIVDNVVYDSVTNIGVRPTIDGITREKVIESHIYDNFDREIYGDSIKVEFLDYIRGEEKFANLEELKKAIANDIEIAKGE